MLGVICKQFSCQAWPGTRQAVLLQLSHPYMTTGPGRSAEGWAVAFGNSALKEVDGKEIQSSGSPRVTAAAF